MAGGRLVRPSQLLFVCGVVVGCAHNYYEADRLRRLPLFFPPCRILKNAPGPCPAANGLVWRAPFTGNVRWQRRARPSRTSGPSRNRIALVSRPEASKARTERRQKSARSGPATAAADRLTRRPPPVGRPHAVSANSSPSATETSSTCRPLPVWTRRPDSGRC